MVLYLRINVAILVGLLVVISKPILGRRRAAWFVFIGLGFYVVLVGAGASVVRAAIMGSLIVIAFYLMGRPTFAPADLNSPLKLKVFRHFPDYNKM